MMPRRKLYAALFGAIAAMLLLAGCKPLPSLDGRPESHALSLQEAAATRLGRSIGPMAAEHPGNSGILPLQDALDAFAARALLARAAERTLDVQYYIWRNDMTGTLLFGELHAAAERGVRVRLLLDDNNTSELDAVLSALDRHPNIEVRLFNPFPIRRPRLLGYLTDFPRLNRRMHNKSFTADNQATIIGGRNIGDEYFGATQDVLFADLDVLAIGPVVADVSDSFDGYWASDSTYPLDRIAPASGAEAAATAIAGVAAVAGQPAAAQYVAATRERTLIRSLLDKTAPLIWAETQMISDDPAKGLGQADPGTLLPARMRQVLGDPEWQLDLVSPYFVPTASGVRAFAELADGGVRINVLTNALEATDVPAVHAGYAKRRRDLLEAGLKLYEMRRHGGDRGKADLPGPLGSSGSSLHAKTFSVDRGRVFIGSFNFDPRSANLNTEMGFVIESPELATEIDEAFINLLPQNAYEVRLGDNGRLYWLEQRGGQTIRHDTEPGTTLWERALVALFSVLPIEWLL